MTLGETALRTAPDGSATARVWDVLRADAERIAAAEPFLAPLLRRSILGPASFGEALAAVLAAKLADADLDAPRLMTLADDAFAADPAIVETAALDLAASVERNPAYPDHVTPFLYAKGYSALEWYRVAHHLWTSDRRSLALYLQGRVSDTFAVDIHPAARIGRAIFVDHATGVVIGETAVVGDDVSILHNVTLGGTGKESGDRHPKIGRGVLLSAGAKVLGNVVVGEGAKVAAGSVVLRPVAPYTTVAGVPAKVVGRQPGQMPGRSMDQDFLDFQI
ncbi:MAG TPA: serine O-acetyltransferase [Candidatus Sulfotelmatobacter sp.]|nr:serine O-acetyltransferase [Candidatus Sulfotelmatobacter sp.]